MDEREAAEIFENRLFNLHKWLLCEQWAIKKLHKPGWSEGLDEDRFNARAAELQDNRMREYRSACNAIGKLQKDLEQAGAFLPPYLNPDLYVFASAVEEDHQHFFARWAEIKGKINAWLVATGGQIRPTDGPQPGRYWQHNGKLSADTLGQTSFNILSHLWSLKTCFAEYSDPDFSEAVTGDHVKRLSREAVKKHQREINAFFSRNSIPLNFAVRERECGIQPEENARRNRPKKFS